MHGTFRAGAMTGNGHRVAGDPDIEPQRITSDMQDEGDTAARHLQALSQADSLR